MTFQKRITEALLFPNPRINLHKLKAKLSHKTVVITGASSGIGKETAIFLANLNIPIHLVLIARREELLASLQTQYKSKHVTIQIICADLREEEKLEQTISELTKLPQGIDYFVNNAGKSIYRPTLASLNRFHDFERTMNINYFAPVKLLLGIIPLLEKNKGHIINVSTVNVAMTPLPHWAAYQASKTAFNTFLLATAPELKQLDITATSIYLPLVKTPMITPTKKYKQAPAMSKEAAATWIAKSMYTKKARYSPWWLIFLEVGSVLFKSFSTFFVTKLMKRS